MKISFSRNMDEEPLVLVDGKVVAVAKDCEGYNFYVKQHIQLFQPFTNEEILSRQTPSPETGLEWTDAWNCKHHITKEHAEEVLKKLFDEWPGGFEEIDSCVRTRNEYAEKLKTEMEENQQNAQAMLNAALQEAQWLRGRLLTIRNIMSEEMKKAI